VISVNKALCPRDDQEPGAGVGVGDGKVAREVVGGAYELGEVEHGVAIGGATRVDA
jgi:hypothetical protein